MNTAIQIKSRKAQIAAVERQIKSGAYSADDIQVLRGRKAQLERILGNLMAKIA